ncbi:hypothetical protein Vi05172_g13303 [Venturia inaequalis]|nr:hypothetical protein Vi05172_g13303 [Venturia inaequalis]
MYCVYLVPVFVLIEYKEVGSNHAKRLKKRDD